MNLFVQILQTDIVGRPIRKFLYLISAYIQKARHAIDVLTNIHPFMVKLELRPNKGRLITVSKYYLHLKAVTDTLPKRPKISVLVPVYKTKPKFLRECIESVTHQVYDHWEICIVDDCSQNQELTEIIQEYQNKFPKKIRTDAHTVNQHISATSNSCLKLATGDYVTFLDHDDRLPLNALGEMVRYINLFDEPDILYSDDRKIDKDGERLNLSFHKPGWSPFLHLCMNYTCHLSLYKTDLLRKINGFRLGYEGSQDYDLMLRACEHTVKPVVHVPLVLYQWRAHEDSTALTMDSKPYAALAGEKAINEALNRRGKPGTASFEQFTGHYRLKFNLPAPLPLVSIVIPSKNGYEFISKAISSIQKKSTYQNYEIIISDNGTDEPKVLAYYESMKAALKDRFKVLIKPAPFNFGRQVNDGMNLASGAYAIILNNDTEVITPEWIEELLQYCQFSEVGAVGCKLLYPDDNTIQHAGIIASGRNIAVHVGHLNEENYNGYMGMINTAHEMLAVTAACMMVKKVDWELAGKFDEQYLANGYGDFEFCLKLKKMGKTTIYTPHAKLYHYESKSRGENIEYFERHYIMRKYGHALIWDDYLNPNLSFTTLYHTDHFYKHTDLNQTEFDFFIKNSPDEWLKVIPTLKNTV